MKLFSDLFVNLSILGTLVILLSWLTKNRKGFISPSAKWIRRLQLGVAMGVIGNILMHYTITFNGTIVDLRQLPVILAALYGGILSPIVAAILIAGGRLSLFGINMASIYASLLIIIIGISCGALSKLKYNLWIKGLVMNVGNLTLTSIVFFILVKEREALINIYSVFWPISLIGGIIITYLTEYLRKSKELLQAAQENATTDFLTGLNNVRKFDEVLRETIIKSDQHQESFSFLLIDIDYFKKVNDEYGHLAGDEVLKQLGLVVKNSCRSVDIVSRNGGEEFSVVMPSCSLEQAIQVAERIRVAVERHAFVLPNGSTVQVTISLGISIYRETTSNASLIIEQADDCLYKAKRTGRNKVVYATS